MCPKLFEIILEAHSGVTASASLAYRLSAFYSPLFTLFGSSQFFSYFFCFCCDNLELYLLFVYAWRHFYLFYDSKVAEPSRSSSSPLFGLFKLTLREFRL